MSYTIVKITTYYKAFLNDHYEKHPEVKQWTFSKQYEHLMLQAFALSDYYSREFTKLGVKAYEIIANAQPLQQAWAIENDVKGDAAEIVEAQLAKYKPNVLIFEHALFFDVEWIESLRAKIPSLKLILGYCCSPFSSQQLNQFKVFDAVIVCSKLFFDDFNSRGKKSIELNHAFEPSILQRIDVDNPFPESDFIFIGSIWAGKGFHEKRTIILEKLYGLGITPDFYGNIDYTPPFQLAGKQLIWYVANLLKKSGNYSFDSHLPTFKKA
ncbi:MAG: hypothetical protein WCH34_19390, partial [Bacteroidota bacterium]